MAKVMIIAGGAWQCPIVKIAKKMGHYVICTNLYENSPAFEYADVGEVADVLDKEKNLQIARKYMPDVILTDQSDIAVPTVAYVASRLGRKGIGGDLAELCTNKWKMRMFCEKENFPSPAYKICYSLEDAIEFFESYNQNKAIIKPLDSQSSRGIFIINEAKDLSEHFNETIQFSNQTKAVLIEEYIDGKEFTVDGIKTENGYYVTAISKKSHYEYNKSVAKELLFSHYDDEFDYDVLRKLNKQMVEKIGLPFGLTHAEYKYHDGKFYLIEIAARGGGTRISSDIVPIMSGINTNEALIEILLDNEIDISTTYSKDIYAVLGFFDFQPGKVCAISGVAEAKEIEGVHEMTLEIKPGDYIEEAKDDSKRVGHYILYAKNYVELRKIEQKVKETIRVEYEE